MLADLDALKCEPDLLSSETKDEMMTSAKLNLAKMDYFAVHEYLVASQYLFSWTFGKSFKSLQLPQVFEVTENRLKSVSSYIPEITEVNNLDMELYSYGVEIFLTRLYSALTYDLEANVDMNGKMIAYMLNELGTVQKMYDYLSLKMSQ